MKFRRKKGDRLKGISEQLWHYERRAFWRLDTEKRHNDSRNPLVRNKPVKAGGEREHTKFTHYIGAGGMRHQTREQAEKQPLAGQVLMWRVFLLFVALWLICRWLPL
jgi:L,D-peptidoglycan transpeptidase YkuD (ErfK/YbiS/YcfS/YnhG family)